MEFATRRFLLPKSQAFALGRKIESGGRSSLRKKAIYRLFARQLNGDAVAKIRDETFDSPECRLRVNLRHHGNFFLG